MALNILQKIVILICVCFLVYIPFLGALYVFQHKLIYHPNPVKPDLTEIQKEVPGVEEVTYVLPTGKQMYAWYLKSDQSDKLVVYFHGNTGNLAFNSKRLTYFAKMGFSVLMPEYEGFGGIKGSLRQFELERDAKTALLWVLSKGYKEENIIIYGHSLGTYVALYASKFMSEEKRPVRMTVLEAPFYSLVDMGKNMFGNIVPITWLMKDGYPSMDLVEQINTQLVIGHGKADKVIPYAQGLKLFEKAKHPKTFFSSDTADHNNLPENGFVESVLTSAK